MTERPYPVELYEPYDAQAILDLLRDWNRDATDRDIAANVLQSLCASDVVEDVEHAACLRSALVKWAVRHNIVATLDQSLPWRPLGQVWLPGLALSTGMV